MKVEIFQVGKEEVLKRLDKVLVEQYPQKTRNYFQKLIADGHILVNSRQTKAGMRLNTGDQIKVNFPDPSHLSLEGKPIPITIIYEDDDVLVINKPAGMVTHPGTHGSHSDDSLVNALLYHAAGKLGGINGILRPGIVHRLDKDTSGLLVVAKNDRAQLDLSSQFKARAVQKTYYALVYGHLTPKKGMIEAPLARARNDRKKMAVSANSNAKEAFTRYKVLEYIGNYSFVEISLLTGRTHQIRVHFAAIGFPIVSDQVYGNEKINKLFRKKYNLNRQFLHAGKLVFTLPGTQKKKALEASLPGELLNILKIL